MRKMTEKARVQTQMPINERINRRHGEQLIDNFIEQTRLSIRQEYEEQLAIKDAKFDQLCKDMDEHDAELKRVIVGLRVDLERAERALTRAGYTHTEGAAEWKPPLGPVPTRFASAYK